MSGLITFVLDVIFVHVSGCIICVDLSFIRKMSFVLLALKNFYHVYKSAGFSFYEAIPIRALEDYTIH